MEIPVRADERIELARENISPFEAGGEGKEWKFFFPLASPSIPLDADPRVKPQARSPRRLVTPITRRIGRPVVAFLHHALPPLFRRRLIDADIDFYYYASRVGDRAVSPQDDVTRYVSREGGPITHRNRRFFFFFFFYHDALQPRRFAKEMTKETFDVDR